MSSFVAHSERSIAANEPKFSPLLAQADVDSNISQNNVVNIVKKSTDRVNGALTSNVPRIHKTQAIASHSEATARLEEGLQNAIKKIQQGGVFDDNMQAEAISLLSEQLLREQEVDIVKAIDLTSKVAKLEEQVVQQGARRRESEVASIEENRAFYALKRSLRASAAEKDTLLAKARQSQQDMQFRRAA